MITEANDGLIRQAAVYISLNAMKLATGDIDIEEFKIRTAQIIREKILYEIA